MFAGLAMLTGGFLHLTAAPPVVAVPVLRPGLTIQIGQLEPHIQNCPVSGWFQLRFSLRFSLVSGPCYNCPSRQLTQLRARVERRNCTRHIKRHNCPSRQATQLHVKRHNCPSSDTAARHGRSCRRMGRAPSPRARRRAGPQRSSARRQPGW